MLLLPGKNRYSSAPYSRPLPLGKVLQPMIKPGQRQRSDYTEEPLFSISFMPSPSLSYWLLEKGSQVAHIHGCNIFVMHGLDCSQARI